MSLGGVADVIRVSAVGGSVCEIELHLSVLGNSIQNSPELPGQDGGEGESTSDFSFPFLSHFWNLGIKRNESLKPMDILENRYVALSSHKFLFLPG